jgi:hypothetical protein
VKFGVLVGDYTKSCEVMFVLIHICYVFNSVGYPGFFGGGGVCSTNSVDDREQREQGSGGGSPLLIRSSTQFANE